MNEHELLRRYSETSSSEAFAELVRLHGDWLYSAALRQVRDPGLAQDVTQAVFLALARKPPKPQVPLAPWLFRVLRYVAANVLRAESRRRHHEHEAAIMRNLNASLSPPSPEWEQLAPSLDAIVEQLSSADREAVLLRFYQRQPFAEVGTALGITEEAARKRVARALEKLRQLVDRRNITLSSATFGTLLLEQTTQAAPEAVIAAATAVAATTSVQVTTLAQGALKMLTFAQYKLVAAAAVVVVAAGTSATIISQALAQSPRPAPPVAVTTAPATRDLESTQRAAVAEGVRPLVPAEIEARARFLAVERFARLPADQQRQELPAFYRDLAPRHMNNVALMILSSIPYSILDRNIGYAGRAGGSSDERWGNELQDAAATLTPDQVADKLGGMTWYNVAAHVRTLHALKRHPEQMTTLVKPDLDSTDLATFQRGCIAVRALELNNFTPRLLEVYLSENPRSQAASSALLWMRDPGVAPPLLAQIEKDPKAVIRHAGLLQGHYREHPADPLLLKLLESPDADIRAGASYALYECNDPALAQPVAKLAKDSDPRLLTSALYIAGHMPDDVFAKIRDDLLPLLSSRDPKLRVEAVSCFAKHKDLKAGPVILEYLSMEKMDRTFEVTIMQALNALAENHFQYNMHSWGPANAPNQRAIARFTAWLEARDALPAGKAPPLPPTPLP